MANTTRRAGGTGHSFSKLFMKLGNGFMAAVLRSPVHGLVDGAFVLLTVTGRKTGRDYTTPVNYVRGDGGLTVLSRRGRTWWRNLGGGRPVTLRLRGERVTGAGRVLDLSREEKEQAVAGFYAALGRPGLPESVRSRLDDIVVVRIRLDGDVG